MFLFQGLEGYSRDPGFDQNTVRDSGKRKYLDGIRDLTATREAGFTKIWAGDAGFCCLSVGDSGNCNALLIIFMLNSAI